MKYAIYCWYAIKIDMWDLKSSDITDNIEEQKIMDKNKKDIFWDEISFVYEVPKEMENEHLKDYAYRCNDKDFFQEISEEQYNLAMSTDFNKK